jgi:Cft2 family RNA processing exonuclease
MHMTFYGATNTVTGSRTLVEVAGKRLLVDCGLFQGFKALRERNWDELPFDPRSLDAVLLTHAHIDHSGALPLLMRHGFKGPVWTTAASADLCEILLMDTAHLQEEEARYRNRHKATRHEPAEPLYAVRDAQLCLSHLKRVPQGGAIDLGDDVQVRFTRAGHILGASSVHIAHRGKSVLFSGDLGRDDDLVMYPPETGQKADWVVVESTYGDRLHSDLDPIDKLGDIIRRTAARGGVVLIPAFAVGRSQGLMYALYRLRQAGAIPDMPIVLDSPMAISATEVYDRHHEEHRLTRRRGAGHPRHDAFRAHGGRVQGPAEAALPDGDHRRQWHGDGRAHLAPSGVLRTALAQHGGAERIPGGGHAGCVPGGGRHIAQDVWRVRAHSGRSGADRGAVGPRGSGRLAALAGRAGAGAPAGLRHARRAAVGRHLAFADQGKAGLEGAGARLP